MTAFIGDPTYSPASGHSNRFLSGIVGSFTFDIYSNTTYIKQNQYTITAITSNFMTRPFGRNLEVIPIKDGFILYYLDWNTTLSTSPTYGHVLVIRKFIKIKRVWVFLWTFSLDHVSNNYG